MDYFVRWYSDASFWQSGMMYNPSTGCGISGFLIRKYMDPKQTNTDWNQSSTNWIELRYAEVLLNRAEAATELVALNAEIVQPIKQKLIVVSIL